MRATPDPARLAAAVPQGRQVNVAAELIGGPKCGNVIVVTATQMEYRVFVQHRTRVLPIVGSETPDKASVANWYGVGVYRRLRLHEWKRPCLHIYGLREIVSQDFFWQGELDV